MSRLLRAALRAYPAERRERDGEVLLDCAAELSAGGSPVLREAAGLVRGGLQARVAAHRSRVLAAPWGAALDRLVVPVSLANLAWWLVGAAHYRTLDLGFWWGLMVCGAVLAVAGAVTGRRTRALTGWLLCAALAAQALLASQGAGPGPRWTSGFGSVHDVDMVAAFGPVVLLGLASATRVHRPANVQVLAWLAPILALSLLRPLADRLDTLDASPAAALLVLGLLTAPVVSVGAARRDPVALARTALLLAAAAPQAGWLVLAAVRMPDTDAAAVLALAVVYGAAALAVLAVARRAGAYHRGP